MMVFIFCLLKGSAARSSSSILCKKTKSLLALRNDLQIVLSDLTHLVVLLQCACGAENGNLLWHLNMNAHRPNPCVLHLIIFIWVSHQFLLGFPFYIL